MKELTKPQQAVYDYMKDDKKPIPISAAKDVAKKYGYDQIIIIGRKVGENGGEHVTTYGVNKDNCKAAAHIGNFLKYDVMKWPRDAQIQKQ